MWIGMIGLGRMGSNLVLRPINADHQCVVYDVQSEAVKELLQQGAIGASSIKDLVTRLVGPALDDARGVGRSGVGPTGAAA